jgi:hypothetical protein
VQPLSHPDFAPKDGKLTIAQIKELSAYAEKFHMKLIGGFQSFIESQNQKSKITIPKVKNYKNRETGESKEKGPKMRAFLNTT